MKDSRNEARRLGHSVRSNIAVASFAVIGASAVIAVVVSCSSPPPPFIVQGPGQSGDEPPTLNITQPAADLTVSQGQVFVIRWTDGDRDSNASISFSLVSTTSTASISLVAGIEENDDRGPDTVSVATALVPVGLYNLRGTITDGTTVVQVFAQTAGTATARNVVINVTEPGQGPLTQPPTITVTEPVFNLSVTQDDVVRVSVQPSALAPAANRPYDADSAATIYIVLDLDQDPNNDDPANEDSSTTDDGIVVLRTRLATQGDFDAVPFDIPIDLSQVPPRETGDPYFIRATITDANNPAVHRYAPGRISVVGLASGTVDLAEIGRTTAGAKWYGFNPGARTGSTASGIGDFDGDGIADFVIVAQFGNPRNFGLVGEAYLVYGQNRVRFGGAIPVNSVSESVSGAIFEAPPVREIAGGRRIPGPAFSAGITSVAAVRDLTADGRPELLLGLPRVHGAVDTTDFDPGDEDPATDATEDVNVVVRQGSAVISVGGTVSFQFPYAGTQDVTISSAAPNTNTGSSGELTWRNDPGANVAEWTLIKFVDVLDAIPDAGDPTLMIDSVQARLRFRVFNLGGVGAVHLATTNFNEQTTFSTFDGGGPPIAGTDYETDPIGTIDGEAAGDVEVDITPVVIDLIEGNLAAQNNELRFIIVPSAAEGTNQTGVRSSEFGTAVNRPTLEIDYSRGNVFGAIGCYSDPWVNNKTDSNDAENDLSFYGGGMAVQINSQNRDSASVTGINTARLESTVVSIELVGQEGAWVWDANGRDPAAGGIFARADNANADVEGNDSRQAGRIAGARFVAGWYDYIDHRQLNQTPREDRFGQTVSSIGDLNLDGLDEIIISAPRNERYLLDLANSLGSQSTQLLSTGYRGSIVVLPGDNYNRDFWRDKSDGGDSTATIPAQDQQIFGPPFGQCSTGDPRNGPRFPADSFEIFAEDVDDELGGATTAGDFNQDGVPDILCGAPRNNRPGATDTGAAYVLYGRNVLGSYRLANAADPLLRPPMLRIRGVTSGDQIGWKQATGLDVNGDRLDDVFISSPTTDFGGVSRSGCEEDFNGDGVVDGSDLNSSEFNSCRSRFSSEDLFSDDRCKAFDYDNDFDIDDDDQVVLDCLIDGGTNCCENLVDNGFVGVIFGGVFTDGDRDITQIATNDLPGARFFGSAAGHRAGLDISSAGDFNQDGFGDLLIVVPGEIRVDAAARERLGVIYLIFGGTHLENQTFSLDQVGTEDLPGIVFFSPYVRGRPNEAAPSSVAFLGDVNNDGFGDIAVGNQHADFIDLRFPQGPDAPGGDAQVGRRRNAGDMYLIYGNNFGSNRGSP